MKMSDVEARREARRRRILENSGKRLQRITGVEQRKASYELEGYKSPNIQSENSIENNVFHSSIQTSESLNNDHISSQSESIYRNPLSSSFLNRSSLSNVEHLTFTKTYKVSIIVGIACLLNILQFLSRNHDFLLLNNIFIPFLCFEAVYLFYNQNNEAKHEITNILRLFFTNIPPQYLSLVIKYFTLFVTITRDVMIFFFAFVCIWFMFKVLHGTLFFL